MTRSDDPDRRLSRRSVIGAMAVGLIGAAGLVSGRPALSQGRIATRPIEYRWSVDRDWSAIDRDPYLLGIERALALETNAVRRRRGLSVLPTDTRLRQIARAHSADMLARGYFDHATPEGLSPADRIAGAYRRFVGTSGENLWQVQSPGQARPADVAPAAVQDWLNSPSHRDNLLRPQHEILAIGVAWRPNQVAVTQLLAAPFTLFADALPVQWRPGQAVDLAVASDGAYGRPVELFWRSPGGRIGEAGRSPIDEARTPPRPGDVQMQLGYPDGGNRLTVVPGPWIEVR